MAGRFPCAGYAGGLFSPIPPRIAGMDADPSKPLPAFGFLTALASAEHGWFGGYLVLSPQGRPLEFRCSTPIAPSRAQEILYGPTLRPHLLAEVIGQALVASAEAQVRLILTDLTDILPLGLVRPEEVICVQPLDTEGVGSATSTATACDAFALKGCRVTLSPASACSRESLEALLAPLAAHVDLCEPFGRIRAALTEAQIASHDAADDAHDRAAAA